MRYSIQNYAEALADVSAKAEEKNFVEIQKNFMTLLRRYGDEAHLPKILEAAERIMRAKDGTRHIVVHLARRQKKSARELVKSLMGTHDTVEEAIDPSLVAGMKIIVNDEQVYDGSLKSKLEKLFG